jgi:hypothetical protein
MRLEILLLSNNIYFIRSYHQVLEGYMITHNCFINYDINSIEIVMDILIHTWIF